jgi:hypothetical protein
LGVGAKRSVEKSRDVFRFLKGSFDATEVA